MTRKTEKEYVSKVEVFSQNKLEMGKVNSEIFSLLLVLITKVIMWQNVTVI